MRYPAAAALLAVPAAALLALAFPSALLNTSTLKYAARRFGSDWRPTAGNLSLRASSEGLLTKRIVLEARDLCVDEVHGRLAGCLARLSLDAVVSVGGRPLLSVRRLERLTVHAGELRWDSTAAAAAPEKEEGSEPGDLVPAWASRMTLGEVDVKVPKIVLVSTESRTIAGLTAAFRSGSRAPLTAEAYAILQGTGAAPGRRWDAELSLDSDLFREGRLSRLDARLRARGDQGLDAAAVARLEPDGDGVRGTLDAFIASKTGKLRQGALEDCRIEARREKRIGTFEPPEADCRVVLQPARFGLGAGPKPKAIAGTASLHGGKAAVRLGPSKGGGAYALSAEAELGAGGRAAAKVSIGRFSELVRLLKDTEFAVPAPLNALDGTVAASARLTGSGGRRRVEFDASTDLSSPRQALSVSVAGGAATSPKPRLEAEVILRRVVVQLPYLELKPAPPFSADPRINAGGPKRGAAPDYDVSVRTSTPVVLSTNLLKSPVPVSLDLRARPDGLEGTIRVEPFDLEAFRQKARVDHITLALRRRGAATALDGKLVCTRAGATVNVLLLGSAEKPVVAFESDPPMPREEIVALVLYGSRRDGLDGDQQASAGNASAAMTSGALGLGSLFLLASTPVDSVGYDAATRSYEITFKLPGGATLSVGSNLRESGTLALRKRLAPHWEVRTEAAGRRGENAITTFLQWFERY